MSFAEAGDLASFAAIAESTIANKEAPETTPAVEDVKGEESAPAQEQTNTGQEGGTGTEARESQGNVASDEQSQSDEQQRTYANLQPIFLAMEMGQEASGQQQEQGQEETATATQVETTTADLTQQVQAFVTNAQSQLTTDQISGGQFVLSQGSQGGSGMLLSNMMTAGSDGNTPVSLATILQDVVSGMQTSAGTVPAAIITDPTSSTGSFLIVNQNGVPIVRPVVVSNIQGGGSMSAETLQVIASSVQAVEEGGAHEAVAVDVAGAQGSTTGELSVGSVEVDIGAVNEEGHPVTVSQDVEMADEGLSSDGGALSMAKSTTARLPTGKRKLSDGPRVCEQCNKAFKYPSDLKKHLQIHTDIKKFKCDECGRFFRRLHQLNVHARIHTGEKPYVCNRCGLAFRHDSTLTMHVRTRHDHLRPFKCEECGNTFGRLSHLKKHIKKVCGDNKNKEKPIAQCRFCEVTFPTKGDLRKHLLTCEKKEAKVNAKEVTLHICDTCTKEFASPYNLRRHQLTHTDEKPFQCDVCSRQFKEKSSLTKHLKRKHTGVDQGSQTEESGDQDYAGHVDVIAESAAASGVRMETGRDDSDDEDDDEEASTVDASSLVEEGGQPAQQSTVTEVGSGDVMATVELSTEATALQAAVEALVSASQQQQLVTQEDPAAAGAKLFTGDAAAAAAAASLIGSNLVYPVVPAQESKPRVMELEQVAAEQAETQPIQYVEEATATGQLASADSTETQEV